jgi:hypothetical protein
VEGNAEQSEARFMVPEVRQHPQEKPMDAEESGPADRAGECGHELSS